MSLISTRFDATSTAADVVAGHDLSGTRAIVTGGGSGIGVETVRALASAGAEVTIAVRDPEQGARAAHDWGLASWLGGSMFGQFALNPAVAKIEDKRERGKVVNAAWNGYNVINALSLGSVALGWFVYAQTGSAFSLGLIGLAQFLPSIPLLAVAGYVLVEAVRRIGSPPEIAGITAGLDLRLFTEIGGMETVTYGAGDIRYVHCPDERIEVEDLLIAVETLALTIVDFCGLADEETTV